MTACRRMAVPWIGGNGVKGGGIELSKKGGNRRSREDMRREDKMRRRERATVTATATVR